MTDLLYHASAAQRYDECMTPDGTLRPGWQGIVDGLGDLEPGELSRISTDVARLLEDDGVTYIPPADESIAERTAEAVAANRARTGRDEVARANSLPQAMPWQLDPVPFVLDAREWGRIEVGLVQRAELLNAVLADVYGAQRLLARGDLPTAAIYGHDEFLRPLVGGAPGEPGSTHDQVGAQPLFMIANDLGRDADGEWTVLSDRTQAPSGAGYAMQNRRVVSRVMPDLYREARLFRLTPFFHTMRIALLEAAPRAVEDPRVVVLTPGTHSETAFDQAFLASLLGFPLVEGNDLTVRDGRVWMRSVDRMEQVDVILRRVDAGWSDPLELRAGSRLGVAGLTEAVRRGTVTVVNGLGSGVLENPALLPSLPQLCQTLLGEPLRMPSVQTWWCGEPAQLSHVLTHLDQLVVRPICRGDGRSVLGSDLDAASREELVARISARPYRFVGQEVLPLSSAPSASEAGSLGISGLVARQSVLRTFAIRQAASYRVMTGGLATVVDEPPYAGAPGHTTGRVRLTKDIWVLSHDAGPPADPATGPVLPASISRTVGAEAGPFHLGPHGQSVMVPRVLDDLFWFGRYAERAEDLARLVLAVRQVAVETDLDLRADGPLPVLLRAVTHTSATYPGFVDADRAGPSAADTMHELRSVVLDVSRKGSVARNVAGLTHAAQGVRDQLSNDVWMVLAGMERSMVALRAARLDQGNQLADTSERVLSGLLALTGITAENMVRDPGWYLLDIGRGIERAQQVLGLLRYTTVVERPRDDESMVSEAALVAAESIVTFRRRHSGRIQRAAVLELLIRDAHNPRSVAYQLHRIRANLRALPGFVETARTVRVLEDLLAGLAGVDLETVCASAVDERGLRTDLDAYLKGLREQIGLLADAVEEQYLTQPLQPQPMMQLHVQAQPGPARGTSQR